MYFTNPVYEWPPARDDHSRQTHTAVWLVNSELGRISERPERGESHQTRGRISKDFKYRT